MVWRFFQAAIVTFILCLNVYFKWTPNPYAIGLLAGLFALGVTWSLSKLIDLLRYGKPFRISRQ